MSGRDVTLASDLGLAEAIGLLRDELLRARATGAASDIQLPVESMMVELNVTVTRSADGRAGFTVPVVGLQLGGSVGREQGTAGEFLIYSLADGPKTRVIRVSPAHAQIWYPRIRRLPGRCRPRAGKGWGLRSKPWGLGSPACRSPPQEARFPLTALGPARCTATPTMTRVRLSFRFPARLVREIRDTAAGRWPGLGARGHGTGEQGGAAGWWSSP